MAKRSNYGSVSQSRSFLQFTDRYFGLGNLLGGHVGPWVTGSVVGKVGQVVSGQVQVAESQSIRQSDHQCHTNHGFEKQVVLGGHSVEKGAVGHVDGEPCAIETKDA